MHKYLSQALRQYYSKEANKIVFQNNLSLNKFALAMWERLDFAEVDASVLSRVLRGERLFTPRQLDIFCSILFLDQSKREYLFFCLHRDRCLEYGVSFDTVFLPSLNIHDLFLQLMQSTTRLFYEGKFNDVKNTTSIIVPHLEQLMRQTTDKVADKFMDLLIHALYLHGRALGGQTLSEDAMLHINPIAKKLESFSGITHTKNYNGYFHMLLASIFYVATNYAMFPKSIKMRKLYQEAIKHAQQAFSLLDNDQPEKLFGLRTLIMCSASLHDRTNFESYRSITYKDTCMKEIPPQYYVMGAHVYHAIARGEALFGLSTATTTFQQATTRFGNCMKGKHVFEVADIRSELEMLVALKSKDKKYIKKRAEQGLMLAEELHSLRHVQNINKLLSKHHN